MLSDFSVSGLIPTYASIKRLWRERFQALSLADFVVLMGTEAAEIAMAKPGECNNTGILEFVSILCFTILQTDINCHTLYQTTNGWWVDMQLDPSGTAVHPSPSQ